MSNIRFVIITGMSGAGKTQAIQALEDMGYFCVDNLPPALMSKFAELCQAGRLERVALGVDVRGGQFFAELQSDLAALSGAGLNYDILFLEADDATLLHRFKETRRRHPLAPREGRVLEAIRQERAQLAEMRERAQHLLDTTGMTPKQLRQEIGRIFRVPANGGLLVTLVSFGFKYGLPLDADLVFDVRFLPNPQYVEDLRDLTGRDARVRAFVTGSPLARQLERRLLGLILFLLPQYRQEGKSQLLVAVGCTGGQHRSVVVVDRLAEALMRHGEIVTVEHRDIPVEVPPASSRADVVGGRPD